MVLSAPHQGALDQEVGQGAHPPATAIRHRQLEEEAPVIPKDQEVGQGAQEGGQEVMEEDQELLREGQEVSLDGLGAQVGGQEARCGDQGQEVLHGDQGQGVLIGDQEAHDQGAGQALLKGGQGGEAQVEEEEGLPPTHLTGDQAHRPHQGHEVPPLRSWGTAGGADGRGHLATEVREDGGRPLLLLDRNLCCPLRKGRRGRRRRVGFWRGCATTRARSCPPTISERSWRARSV